MCTAHVLFASLLRTVHEHTHSDKGIAQWEGSGANTECAASANAARMLTTGTACYMLTDYYPRLLACCWLCVCVCEQRKQAANKADSQRQFLFPSLFDVVSGKTSAT